MIFHSNVQKVNRGDLLKYLCRPNALMANYLRHENCHIQCEVKTEGQQVFKFFEKRHLLAFVFGQSSPFAKVWCAAVRKVKLDH